VAGRTIERVVQWSESNRESTTTTSPELRRVGPVVGQTSRRLPKGERILTDERPAMFLPKEMRARGRRRGRGAISVAASISSFLFLLAEIGKGHEIGAGNQPVQHAVLADVVYAHPSCKRRSRPKRFRHAQAARDFFLPQKG